MFDLTGLKVYGEGEWKVRRHGMSKRRNWRKLRIAIDPSSGETILAEFTNNEKATGALAKRNKDLQEIAGFGGDDEARKISKVLKGNVFFIKPPIINY